MKKYKISPAEDWVIQEGVDLSCTGDDDSPYYFILVDYQDLILDEKICRYRRTVEKINDESRIEDASLCLTELQDENHQIIFHSIDIVRDGVRYSVLDENKISVVRRETSLENHITDRVSTVSFSIDDLRVGDIVDYQATTVIYGGDHPLNGKYYYSLFWLNWNCVVSSQKIRIINRAEKTILIQHCPVLGRPDERSVEKITCGDVVEKKYADLKILSMENIVPRWVWPECLLATTETSWSGLSMYLYEFYDAAGVFDSGDDLCEGSGISLDGSQEEKIIGIVRFVQNEIRYKGENHGVFTHTPKPARATLEKRYGDCKDKSNLLVSLLRSIGVNARLALVNTEYGLKLDELNPSPYHFNHMIVCVEYDDDVYYFDPTIKKQSGDLSHSTTLNYGYGLVLSGEGSELRKLPHDIGREVYAIRHVFDFSRQASDSDTLSIERTFYRHRADNMRFYLHSKEQGVLSDEYLKYALEDSGLELSVLEPMAILADDAVLNRLETKEVYRINGLAAGDDNKLISLPTHIYHEFPVTTCMDFPVRIDLDGKVRHDIEVIYKGYRPKGGEKESVVNQWFEYHDSVNSDGNVLYLSATAVPLREYVEPDRLKEYFDDVEKMRLRSVNNFLYQSGDSSYASNLGSWMLRAALIVFVIVMWFVQYRL